MASSRAGIGTLISDCRALILDFDDTVVATFKIRSRTLSKALADFGYRVDQQLISTHWGKAFPELIEALAPGVVGPKFLEHYTKCMLADPPVGQPCIRPFLEQMKKRSVYICIHSSSLTRLVASDLEAAELSYYIDEVFGIDRTLLPKPQRESLDVVLHDIARKGIGSEDVLYIGDSLRDLAVASEHDLRFIAVLTGQTTRTEFRTRGDNFAIANSLCELVL